MTEQDIKDLEEAYKELENPKQSKSYSITEFEDAVKKELPGWVIKTESYRDSNSFANVIRGHMYLPLYFAFKPDNLDGQEILTPFEVAAVVKKAKAYITVMTKE